MKTEINIKKLFELGAMENSAWHKQNIQREIIN